MPKRLNIAALAIACIALFAPSAATSYAMPKRLIAALNIKKNAVTHKKIKDGHVRSPEIKNGAVQMADLSGSLQDQVESNFELLDGSVTTTKLADNAVDSAKVAPDSLAAADLAPNSVGSSEVLQTALARVTSVPRPSTDQSWLGTPFRATRSRTAVSMPWTWVCSGTSAENFSSIAAGTCDTVGLDPSTSTDSIAGKAALVTPRSGFSGSVSFHAEVETSTLVLKACNPTGGAIDPDGAGGTNYNYIVFG